MREVLLYPWQDSDFVNGSFPFLEDLVKTMIQKRKETKEIWLILINFHDSDWVNEERLEQDFHQKYGKNFYVEAVQVDEKLSFARKSEQLLQMLKENVSTNDRIYLHVGHGNGHLQHLLSHICVQHYHQQLVILTGNDKAVSYYTRIPMRERMTDYAFLNHVREFLYSGNYQSAKRIIKSRYQSERIEHVLDFGTNLFSLETSIMANRQLDMFDYLSEALQELDNNQDEIDYVKSMRAIMNQDQTAFIKFLYNYAQFLYQNEDLVDFIVLYYRLAEETLLYALGWDYDERDRNHTKFRKRKGARYQLDFPNWRFSRHFYKYFQALQEEIARIKKKHRGSVYEKGQTFVGMERLSERDRYFVDVYLKFNDKQLNEILDLRHEGVSGHGFADFSVEKFEAICGGMAPLGKMEPILEELGLLPEHSLFKLIAKVVLGELARLDKNVFTR